MGRAGRFPTQTAHAVVRVTAWGPGQNKMRRKRSWLSKAITFLQAISKRDKEPRGSHEILEKHLQDALPLVTTRLHW